MNPTDVNVENYMTEIKKKKDIASQLVSELSQSKGDSLDDYVDKLVKLGDAAIESLKKFIAEEEFDMAVRFDCRDFGDYRPHCYAAVKALNQIIMQSESCIYIG